MDLEDDTLGDFELPKKKLEKKKNFSSIISSLWMCPFFKSCFLMPICRLEPLPVLRSILEIDVYLLENDFSSGYREGNSMLYVSVINNLGVSLMVTMEKLETWSPLWQACK